MNFLRLIPILFLATLSACGWVDSTGKQSGNPTGSTGGGGGNGSHTLTDGGFIAVVEQSSINVQLSGSTSTYSDWNWRLTENGDPAQCESVEGFFYDYAENSLGDACTNTGNCMVQFTETSNNGTTGFNITIPQLKTSAVLRYELSATKPDGAIHTQAQTLCAIAINEAPDSNNDRYRVIASRNRFVSADEFNSILSNDYDDIDDRNERLRVNPVPVQPPRYADSFELYTDGSMTYRYNNEIEILPGEELIDSFTYEVTDGLHISTAAVTLIIVESNRTPRRDDRIDDIYLELNSNAEAYLYLDASQYFSDRDGDTLQFFSTGGALFDSGQITLTEEGVLSGAVSVQDIGEYRVTLIASDGLARASDTFDIEIATAYDQSNSYPIASDISNRTVENQFTYDVSEFFYDPDGDKLYFTASNLPALVTISEDGIITGTSSSQNRGLRFITVTAMDGRGGSVSDGFNLRIN